MAQRQHHMLRLECNPEADKMDPLHFLEMRFYHCLGEVQHLLSTHLIYCRGCGHSNLAPHISASKLVSEVLSKQIQMMAKST